MVRRATAISFTTLPLQWVPGGAQKAEESFFRINQQATYLDPTELDMIVARKKANALAARAFIRAGTGHKYWSAFDMSVQVEIERLAKEVFETLFQPVLDLRIRSTDLPVGGRGYSADSIGMLFELVNYVNGVKPEMWQLKASKRKPAAVASRTLPDDSDGTVTLAYMKKVRRAAGWITGNDPGSLGLHPAVYFYGGTGAFQPSAFLAAVAFVNELHNRNLFGAFTATRRRFENFLVGHKYFLNQLNQSYGAMQKSTPHILHMYRVIFDSLSKDMGDADVVVRLKEEKTLKRLRVITDEDREFNRNYSRQTKDLIAVRAILESALSCGICGSRLHYRSSSVDHIVRKEDGGTGSPENAQLTHPYCNSGYKEGLVSARKRAGTPKVGE